MKSKLFLIGAASILLTSCSNELDVPVNQAISKGNTPLIINVIANPTTKALVEGSTFSAGSKIGVKLVAADGSAYDGQPYNNIFYNTTDGSTWTVDSEHKIPLSATEGKAYAYYPYDASENLDFTAIPIFSAADPDEQKDYMYGDEARGLKNSNSSATFTMSHAMSIVKFTIDKGFDSASGTITSVKMKGETASNEGTMNAIAGSVTATAAGYEFESTAPMTLGSSTGKFIVVPSGETSALSFKVEMDGQTYRASTDPLTLESGKVYEYTLIMNHTGMTVSTVSVTQWGAEQNLGIEDAESYDPTMTWGEAKAKDGVYAIKEDGNVVPYTEVKYLSVSYAGVGFVMNGNAYQVAKKVIRRTIWWPDTDSRKEIDGMTYYSTVDGTNSEGYLPVDDGLYGSEPHLDADWTRWPNYNTATAVLSDFNGKANTELIIAAQTTEGVVQDNTLAKAVIDFRGNSSVNEGHTDWFVPACGELAFMIIKQNELNDLLCNKVSGDEIVGIIGCSSVFSYTWAWCITDGGWVFSFPMHKDPDIWLIRTI